MTTPDFALLPPPDHPSAHDEIMAGLDRLNARLDALLTERAHIATVLRTFYRSDISISTLQPLLDLCTELMPDLTTEPR